MDEILRLLQTGAITLEEAKARLAPELDLGFAKLDVGREERIHLPEAVYGEGKSLDQLRGILQALVPKGRPILVTRLAAAAGEVLAHEFSGLIWNPQARLLHSVPPEPGRLRLGVVTAGTTDLPVAMEAKLTALVLGLQVESFWDVGVAGLHRLTHRLPELRELDCLIVVAGMDGVLPSVLGGLVSAPLIAVPTSVGYGANFQGLAPLLTMLNACAQGIAVVNIDNGFGAAMAAYRILNRSNPEK